MKFNFKKKIVVVTGGEGGIGKSISDQFVKLGANVIVTTRNKNKLKMKTKKKNYIYLDFNNENSINIFLSKIRKLNKIDILINCAGINKLYDIDKINKNFLDQIYKVNLRGPIILTNEISKKMIKKRSGRIVNISSIFGVVSKSGRSLYSSTKFGLIGLTKSSALDLAKNNILVNSVSPGVIKTKLTTSVLNRQQLMKIKKEIPLNRLGDVQDVSNLVCFLCSELNNYITGQNFIVDGGYTSK
tara:strand:- start:4163 stop:4891 length:729 start_codon:yes stop_codon:yes gene_type:complete